MYNYKRKFCIAPMMGYTTPHARKLYRILSKNAFLFTEMVPCKELIFSKNKNLKIENDNSNPIALQVGGIDFNDLAESAQIAKNYNYDEINLNVGCPSKAVQKGKFGACLMNNKILVRNCLEVMKESSDIDVSVKCRIGLGKEFNYDFFYDFIDEIIKSGINIIYVHARNAILNGFSPKNNRNIPPLNYEFVKKIKNEFPNINFILNGGINNLEEAYNLLKFHDGVMLGRLIQNNPFCLLEVDKIFFNSVEKKISHTEIISEYFEYVKNNLEKDSIFRLLSPLLSIFFGLPNSKSFKTKINYTMKNSEIDKLESTMLEFVNGQKIFAS